LKNGISSEKCYQAHLQSMQYYESVVSRLGAYHIIGSIKQIKCVVRKATYNTIVTYKCCTNRTGINSGCGGALYRVGN
jgi:hypothetical protein